MVKHHAGYDAVGSGVRGGSGSGFDAGWSVAVERLVAVGAGVRCALVRWGRAACGIGVCVMCGRGAVDVRC